MTERTILRIVLGYWLIAFVAFGIVSATQKDVCERRAYDPPKCRVMSAVPAAAFWPLAISYVVGDLLIND